MKRLFALMSLIMLLTGCNTMQGLKQDAQQGGQAVGKGLQKAGEAIGNAVQKSGEAIENVAK